MEIRIKPADLEFLRSVQEMGMRGLTQSDIAAEIGMTPASLRYRLNRLGFEPEVLTDLRTCLGNRRFAEMLENGELVATEEEPAAVCSAA